jgi:gas vesicle protein
MFKYILAAAAGVTIGLLFAPKAGEKLREDLSDQMNDSIERGKTSARRISKRPRAGRTRAATIPRHQGCHLGQRKLSQQSSYTATRTRDG